MLQRIFLIILFGTLHLDDRKLKSQLLQVLLLYFQLPKSWGCQGLGCGPCTLVNKSKDLGQILEVWKMNSLDVLWEWQSESSQKMGVVSMSIITCQSLHGVWVHSFLYLVTRHSIFGSNRSLRRGNLVCVCVCLSVCLGYSSKQPASQHARC